MQAATIDRTKQWTVEDYLVLGEIKTPCQLINGELIGALPQHHFTSVFPERYSNS
jgi:hypothetical protein